MKGYSLAPMAALYDPPDGRSKELEIPAGFDAAIERAFYSTAEQQQYWTLRWVDSSATVISDRTLREQMVITEQDEPPLTFRPSMAARLRPIRVRQARSDAAKRAWITIRAKRAGKAAAA